MGFHKGAWVNNLLEMALNVSKVAENAAVVLQSEHKVIPEAQRSRMKLMHRAK
jgi:hypothetical protein